MSYLDKREQLYRDIILDHYKNPRNQGLVDKAGYSLVHLKNPSCGDDLIMQMNTSGEMIEDVRFTGTGCAICCASASMLSENLQGKTKDEAKTIMQQFYAMVSGKTDFSEETLQDATSLQGVAKLPPRIKCATLAYKAAEQLLFATDVADPDIETVK